MTPKEATKILASYGNLNRLFVQAKWYYGEDEPVWTVGWCEISFPIEEAKRGTAFSHPDGLEATVNWAINRLITDKDSRNAIK